VILAGLAALYLMVKDSGLETRRQGRLAIPSPRFFDKCPLGPTGPRNLMKIAPTSGKAELVTLTPLISARLDLRPRVFRPCAFKGLVVF